MIELLSAASFWQEMTSPEKTVFCAYLVIIGVVLICFIAFGIALAKLIGRGFIKSCKTIGNFCNESGDITDANLEQFEATCLNEKTDRTFLEGWESFKEQRCDYPSQFIDVDKIKSKYSSKKFKVELIITSCVLFLISVFFAIYGIVVVGAKDGTEIAPMVIELLLPIVLLLSFVFVKPEKKVYVECDQMLEDLDAAVKLQRFVNRQIDNSRLFDIENRIREIIIAEQSKPIPSKKEQFEKQKEREAAELAALEESSVDETSAEEVKEESAVENATSNENSADNADENASGDKYTEAELDDVRDELFGDDEDLDEVRDELYGDDEDLDKVRDEIFGDDEEQKKEEVASDEAPKKKVVPFTPFVSVLNEALDREYPKSTMRKIANVLVLAFAKFEEPEQREELKNCIRKFIKSYKAAIDRERAEENVDAEVASDYSNNVDETSDNVEEIQEENADDESENNSSDDDYEVAPAPIPLSNEEAYGEWQPPQVD